MPAETRKKKRFGCLKIVLYFFMAIVLLMIVWLAFNLGPVPVPGHPLVEVSKETTRITEPLDENGDVDFLEAINLRCSEGVTLENNSFVKLIEAVGPLANNRKASDAVTQRLGMESLPEEGQYLLTFELWIDQKVSKINAQRTEQYEAELEKLMDLESADLDLESEAAGPEYPEMLTAQDYGLQQLSFASQHPWSAEELPEVEQWRKANEAPLKIAREGIARPDYYYPLVSDSSPKMLGDNLGYTKAFSNIGECLQVSAMSRLYQDDVDGCIEDIKAQHQLAIQISRGPTLVEELVCHKLISEAMDSLASLCASQKANPAQLKSLLQWVKELEIPDDAGQRVDQTDRYVGLDACISMARASKYSRIVDWRTVLEQLNTDYDRFVEVGEIKDAAEFAAAWSILQDEMVANESWVMGNSVKSALMGRKSKGVWVGRLLSGTLMPSVEGLVDSENEIKAKRDMLRLVIAATLMKNESGRYPSSIDELIPKYLDENPVDPFTGQPFVFAVTNYGIQVHSQAWNDPRNGVQRNKRMAVFVEQHTWETFRKEEQEEEHEEELE